MKKRDCVEPFVMLPKSLLESAAWQTAGINTHRLVWFLMIEHMRHGGKENGELRAPRRQLESFGIGSHFVSAAINDAQTRGLIDVRRGTGRASSRYGLAWLPFIGGRESSQRWRHYQQAGSAA